MTMKLDRFLFLHDDRVLGRDDGPGRFSVHGEFWGHIQMLFPEELGPLVSEQQAAKVAAFVDENVWTKTWQMQLSTWNKHSGTVVKEFLVFLRGGQFGVSDLRKPIPVGKVDALKPFSKTCKRGSIRPPA